jgi:hypothetical protein
VTPSETQLVNDLLSRVISAEHRLQTVERLLTKVARQSGHLPPMTQAQVTQPATVTSQSVSMEIAAKAAAGSDPIEQLADALRDWSRKTGLKIGDLLWERAIDHIGPEHFLAANRLFSETIGRGAGLRSVEGFKAHVLDVATRREAAAHGEAAA